MIAECRSYQEAWERAAYATLIGEQRESRGGPTRDVWGFTFNAPAGSEAAPLVSRGRRPINVGFAAAEALWILAGEESRTVVDAVNPRLKDFAGDADYPTTYPGAYGRRLRSPAEGTDQLLAAARVLATDPDSRQGVLVIWDVDRDASLDGKPPHRDVPCNVTSVLRLCGDELRWAQFTRSSDVWLGLPYDLHNFWLLHWAMARELSCRLDRHVELGVQSWFAASLHAYERDVVSVREALGESPRSAVPAYYRTHTCLGCSKAVATPLNLAPGLYAVLHKAVCDLTAVGTLDSRVVESLVRASGDCDLLVAEASVVILEAIARLGIDDDTPSSRVAREALRVLASRFLPIYDGWVAWRRWVGRGGA